MNTAAFPTRLALPALLGLLAACGGEPRPTAEDARAFVEAIQRARPAGAKGTYVKKVSVSSSMGPGVKVDVASLSAGG